MFFVEKRTGYVLGLSFVGVEMCLSVGKDRRWGGPFDPLGDGQGVVGGR